MAPLLNHGSLHRCGERASRAACQPRQGGRRPKNTRCFLAGAAPGAALGAALPRHRADAGPGGGQGPCTPNPFAPRSVTPAALKTPYANQSALFRRGESAQEPPAGQSRRKRAAATARKRLAQAAGGRDKWARYCDTNYNLNSMNHTTGAAAMVEPLARFLVKHL